MLHSLLNYAITKGLIDSVIFAMLFIINISEAKPRFCERNL